MIEGLTTLTGPRVGNLSSHKFSLPPGFPHDRMSSKWVEDGPEVIEAAQPQILESAGVSAQGWQPYKIVDQEATEKRNEKIALDHATSTDRSKSEKPKFPTPIQTAYVRVIGKKKFVLLMRPKALQGAVNKIYSDISRNLVNQEVKGETSRANESNDPGVITNADLRQVQRYQEPDAGEDYLRATAGGQPSRLNEAADLQIQ